MKKKKKPSARYKFEANDILKFKLIKDIQVSPNGKEVLYEVQVPDSERDDEISQIYALSTYGGGEPKQLTTGTSNDTQPRWSPRGDKVVFLSDRDQENVQLFIINRSGGEARKISSFPEGVSDFSWGADGETLLVVVPLTIEEKPEDIDDEQWEKRPRVIDSLKYKSDGSGYTNDQAFHLYSLNIETLETVQLTKGNGSYSAAIYSPDMKKIIYVKNRESKTTPYLNDLWIMDSDGRHKKQLTCSLTSIGEISCSPNGRWIVFTATDEAGKSLSWPHLYDLNQDKLDKLFEEDSESSSFVLDTNNAPIWSSDSRSFIYLRSYHGTSQLARINLELRNLQFISKGERQITLLHGTHSRLVYHSVSITEPGDIYTSDFEGHEETRLTHINDDWWKTKLLPHVEKRLFTFDKNDTAEGYLLTPHHKKGPYPLLVDIHGGPHSFVEFGFSYHVYWYMLLSRGWAILTLNSKGSTSYGLEYADKLRGHWGERDLNQQLEAIKQLEKDGIVDGEKVAIAGKSYGGYMAAWAVGHSHKFKAAIVSAPVTNLESHAGTSDSGYYVGPYDQKKELLKHRELYRRLSPVSYVHKVRTPTLILHGEDDQRCPLGQSEEFFTGLMRNEKAPAQLVIYPKEGHSIAEAGNLQHRMDYHQRIVDWVQEWCH